MTRTGLPALPEGYSWRVTFADPFLTPDGLHVASGWVSLLGADDVPVDVTGFVVTSDWPRDEIEQYINEHVELLLDANFPEDVREQLSGFQKTLDSLAGDYPPKTLIKAL